MFFGRKNTNKRRENCNTALESARNLLPEELAENINLLMNEHNEWDAGIEMLIDSLAEMDIHINQAQYAALQGALSSTGLEYEDRMIILDELLER